MVNCEENIKEINSLIIGKWQLIGLQTGNISEWIKVEDSAEQTKEFMSNGEYLFNLGENISCRGSYVFESDNTIRLKPKNIGLFAESVETIYTLTTDTLIISNFSFTILCSERKEKCYRIE